MGDPTAGISQRPLHELPFVDIYLRLDQSEPARYHPVPDERTPYGNYEVPLDYAASLERLRKKLLGTKKDDFSFVHEGVRMRASLLKLASGQVWCVLRWISGALPSLEELNFRPQLLPIFRSFGGRSGLIVIAGATGNGKTTLSVALLADYLRRYGMTALTLEDPIEYMLQGEHGRSGYCFQVEVQDEKDWGKGVRTGLRWHPRYFLVGEIRSADCAAQVLRAATSGHLVITTVHAGSIEETLSNLIQIAEAEVGTRASHLLADGLIAVIHLRLLPEGPVARILVTEEGNSGDPVRGHIREHNLKMLGTQIEMQNSRAAQMSV